MNRLILIRHGATAGNLQRRYIGRTDEPLCEAGIQQVLALREQGMRLKDAAREVAEHTGLSKNELYTAALNR